LFDLSLRSFSRDFEAPQAQMSRPWLDSYRNGSDDASFHEPNVPAMNNPLFLLFKARARYDNIDLKNDNPQVRALHEMLVFLQHIKRVRYGQGQYIYIIPNIILTMCI
jgi:hypothetical protein